MPAASSGRYQSRLFNFAHQQSVRLTQQCDRAFRHLQVASSAVVSVLLYPLYLLFQSTAAKQLHRSGQHLPQLSADNPDSQPELPTVDTPIQQVLQAVGVPSESAVLIPQDETQPAFLAFWRFKFFPNNSKSTSNLTHPSLLTAPSPSPTCKRPTIQGIATQLSSRTLVLVTAQNEVLDIFTPQQQQKLQERIIREVAEYWRYQRLAHSEGQLLTKRIVPTGLKLFSPVSLFSGIIAWVQTRAIAIAGSFFQKSSLVRQQDAKGELPQVEGRSPHRALLFLDRTVAALESKHLAPVVALAPETHPSQIKTLIFAAINYFFGDGFAGSRSDLRIRKPTVATTPINASLKLPASSTRASTFKLPSAQFLSADGDPWLTCNDLFGEPDFEAPTLQKPSSMSQTTSHLAGKTNLVSANQVARYSLRNLLNRLQTFLPQQKQASGRGLPQKTPKGKELGEVRSKQLPHLSKSPLGVDGGEISNRSRTLNTYIEPQPDWIEITATAIGYVKHPLEQLLAWLDRIMLWLEEIVVRVLQRVQRLWQGK